MEVGVVLPNSGLMLHYTQPMGTSGSASGTSKYPTLLLVVPFLNLSIAPSVCLIGNILNLNLCLATGFVQQSLSVVYLLLFSLGHGFSHSYFRG
ncbi:hypothetical protein GDO81_013237 [Engystomops pustulosus]|uniref:Uncharacterized protein n=1 Tax=Engystomops pustulosus TaxID=76066 RepID=A0AAV7AYX7_ENGPU|nr:hypothetical protein GDO81_013237 [Engystomops pustulosus]